MFWKLAKKQQALSLLNLLTYVSASDSAALVSLSLQHFLVPVRNSTSEAFQKTKANKHSTLIPVALFLQSSKHGAVRESDSLDTMYCRTG